jgi:4-diphosphocytidyl-2-C-methyl-D-erythritol kinase
MILYPHAKINIGLSVIEKRSDGFHNIETVFYPVPLCDTLTVEHVTSSKAQKLNFICDNVALTSCDPLDNLCCKAYNLLDADFNLPPTSIRLRKAIPVGAGLGGGSSDAAYTLLALNDLYKLQISNEKLTNYASRLGSDCAFFLQRNPAFGTGKGDILEPVSLSLSGYHIVLIKSSIFVSTAEAYSSVIPEKKSFHLPELLQAPVTDWRKTVFNDFEKSIFKKFPEIGKIKERLYDAGALYASMSGSGGSVYGIFKENPIKIAKLFPDSFCWSC